MGKKKQNLIISYHILQVFTTLVLRPWKLSGFKMTTFHHISISKQYIKHFKILKSYSTSYKTELTHDGETKTNLIQIPPPQKRYETSHQIPQMILKPVVFLLRQQKLFELHRSLFSLVLWNKTNYTSLKTKKKIVFFSRQRRFSNAECVKHNPEAQLRPLGQRSEQCTIRWGLLQWYYNHTISLGMLSWLVIFGLKINNTQG